MEKPRFASTLRDKSSEKRIFMDSLIYSLNATVPVFLVMIIGYILRRIGIISEEFVKSANKFNFKVTLPAVLIRDLMNADFNHVFDGGYVLFCALATTGCFISIWIGAKLFMKNKSLVGEFVQASFRGSAAVLGSAFVLNIYGTTGMVPLMIVGSVPLFNIFSVIVLSLEAGTREEGRIKKAAINIIKNPILIGIVIGMGLSVLEVDFPKIIDTTIDNFAKMATPLALVCIGAAFEGKKAIKLIGPTAVSSVIKLIIQPAIFLPIACLLGYTGEKMIALIIMLGAPTTPSCYIMAKNMNHEGVLTSGTVVTTTVMSAFTITLCLFVVRALGLV